MATKDRSSIEPTLFIGLGGAGGKILGRLRSIFDHEFRANGGGESPVQFLLLDTDDFQKLDDSVRSSLNEQEEFLSISHFNPRHYIDEHRRDHRSDLHRWFDWDARPLLEDAFIRDGASRLRILGRLCFHRSYYEVEKVLADKIARAKSARAYVAGGGRLRTTERPFRVVIVGSTCGGTGSGIFLDLVYLVNRLIRSAGATPDVLSFLFLPYWFIDANRQIDTDLVPYYQANAWAFFEELNYVLLNPSRLAEIALDPGRPNGVPADPVRADYEPLKTVYLMDSEIPNVGRFHDANDWNAYVAQSIFQVFLAPEEGNLESVYSNIKTKLGETDRRYGLKKRFAAIGYADLRHPGGELHHFLAGRAATEYIDETLMRAPESQKVEHAARELREAFEGIIERAAALSDATEPQLSLDVYSSARGQSRVPNLTQLGKLGTHVDQAVSAFNGRLPTAADVDQAVGQARALLKNRLGKLSLGIVGERLVLERIFGAMTPVSADIPAVPPVFDLGPNALAGTKQIETEINRSKNFLGRGGPSNQTSTYLQHLNALNKDLQDRAADYKQQRDEAIRAELLLRTVGVLQNGEWHDPLSDSASDGSLALSLLGDARQRLQRAHADLKGVSGAYVSSLLETFARHESLTTRYFPAVHQPEATWARFRPQYVHVVADRAYDLEQAVRSLAPDLLDGAGRDRQDQIVHTIQELGRFFGGTFQHSTDVLTALEKECERLASLASRGDDRAKRDQELMANLLQNLYPLSTPCCRIDESRLSRGDTTPRVFVAAANRQESDVQTMLRLPAVPGVIDNDGEQFALLQAVYAFPTLAVAGMEALRQAYESRDRARSFPHIQREWNQNSLRVSREGELTDQELLQFGRARAVSDLMDRLSSADPAEPPTDGAPKRRVFLPGLRFVGPGSESDAPMWLLRYEVDPRDGRPHLRARAVQPVEGHRRVWTFQEVVEDLQVLDLDQNVRRYIASPVRETHERLLATDIHELERGEHHTEFASAYREYGAHLETIAKRYATDGRADEQQLHDRLAQVMLAYADGLRGSDDPTP